MNRIIFLLLLVSPLFFSGCSKDGGVNIFSIQDDIRLGQQTKAEIAAHPGEFPILSEAANPAAYNYIRAIRDEILATGKLNYKDEFAWEVYIIKKDDVQNAFCAPGGYIYVYTGLIKYLESKSALAGVMGHEMAHADERHTTEQLTKQYGVQTLLGILVGENQNLLTEIATGLVSLRFSRGNEAEADESSVIYLCGTKYEASGAADFFQKIIDQGGTNIPEFLSTHPNPDNRVQNIHQHAQELGCHTSIDYDEDITGYNQFKNSL